MLMFDFRSLKGLGSLGGVSSCVGEQSFHYCSSCFCCSCCIYSKEHVLNASPDLRIRPFLQVGHDCIEFLLVMPLQRAEDLGGAPVWVFNYGISHNDEVDTSSILPFLQEHWPPWPKRKSKDFFLELEKNFFVWAAYVQGCSDPSLLYEEILDGLEFAKGALDSAWGSVQVAMGHLEPFLRLGMKTVERRITVISIDGMKRNTFQSLGSTKTVLTSRNMMDENSFKEPNKVSKPANKVLLASFILILDFRNCTCKTVKGATVKGHLEPFDLRYVAVGNEDCGKKNYREDAKRPLYMVAVLPAVYGYSVDVESLGCMLACSAYVGRLFVKANGKPTTLLTKLKELAGIYS
ncbi:hypothetical protein RHMOL_Rhmol06G0133400 [Rhododendron molle]|uniref:Uncharacterized protein n=1 Tax=Rhododendron molle TaxID=49168 RepID=A0ACC0NCZ8_RHOML|nr:hypothetical protein RHMOL_Rhmol06G0133400 [Rhododendron molle]